MPTLTIEVDSETYERLTDRARQRNVEVGDVAAELVRESTAPTDQLSDEFRALTARIIETYRPVLTRLGQ